MSWRTLFQILLYSICSTICVRSQAKAAGDQIAANLAGIVLNALFPQLNNNRNDNLRPQPTFSNVPVLTAPRTEIASSPFLGLPDGPRATPVDLQSFPAGAPFLNTGSNQGTPQNLPLFSSAQSSQPVQPFGNVGSLGFGSGSGLNSAQSDIDFYEDGTACNGKYHDVFKAPDGADVRERMWVAGVVPYCYEYQNQKTRTGAIPSLPQARSSNLLDEFSRIGILPTLINLAKKPSIGQNPPSPTSNEWTPSRSLPVQSIPNASPGLSDTLLQQARLGLYNPPNPWQSTAPTNASDLMHSALFLPQPQLPSSSVLQQQQWPSPNGLLQSAASQQLSPKTQQETSTPTAASKTLNADEENFGSNCPQCLPIDLTRLAGPWVQVYGNPQALKAIYTSIAHLQSLYGDDSVQTMDFSVIQPTCIGIQFSKPQKQGHRSESTLNLFFRDNSNSNQLHEAVGRVKQDLDASPNSINFKLPAFDLPMCLVKSGPETSTMYGYIILTETIGTNRCRSYHVFARKADAFFRDYNTEAAAYLKAHVEVNSVKPKGSWMFIGNPPALGFSLMCTLLEAGFDRVRLSPSPFFRDWDSRTEIPIIYAHSPGASTNISVETPDLGTLHPSAPGEKNTKNEDITFEKTSIGPGISQAKVIVHRTSYLHQGDYEFVISSRHTDGRETPLTHGFFLRLDAFDFAVGSPERVSPANVSTYIAMGHNHLLRLYLQQAPILDRTRLIVEEQVPARLQCRPEVRTPKDAMDKCGLRGFSLFKEENARAQVGVQILLAARKPCVLTVITALHFAHNATVKSSVFITTVDVNIFGEGEKVRKAAIRVDPPLERGEIAYINETINVRCILPNCHLFMMSWGKFNGTSFNRMYPPFKQELGTQYNLRSGFSNGSVVTFSDSPEGRVTTMRIPSLQYDDSGWYLCMLRSPSSSNQFTKPEVAINITVKDPVKPYFSDGKQEKDVTLPKGGDVLLFCNATGDPEPKIRWYTVEIQAGTNSSSLPVTGQTFRTTQPGRHICIAWNKYGETNRTFNIHYAPEIDIEPIAIAIPTTAVFLALVGSIFWWLRRRAINAPFRELSELLKNPPQPIPIDDTVPLNDQAQFIPYNREKEIKRDRFTVTLTMLGEGAYGYIFKGELKMDGDSDPRFVAVKLPRDPYNLQHFGALVDEMKVMCQIRPHVNVLALAGACTDNIDKKQLFVLTEFCENGSLKDYLTQRRMQFEGLATNEAGQFVGSPGAVETLLKYSYQAANGMTHLAAERIIHRDLALRNLLLTANNIVKIADFGLSRQCTSNEFRPSKVIPVPIFWTAIEALNSRKEDRTYTQKSDVWSFGIVLWEMFSCSRMPYPGHRPDPFFCNWLKETEENRMAPPKIACEEMYELMRRCWTSDPAARPTFSECKRIIARTLEQKSPSMYESLYMCLSEGWLELSMWSGAPTSHSDRLEDADVQQPDRQPGEGNPHSSLETPSASDTGQMSSQDHSSQSNMASSSMVNSGGDVLPQNRTHNPFLEESEDNHKRNNYTVSDQYSITPIERYEAVLTYGNISTAEIVICSSTERDSEGRLRQSVSTRIQVDVHTIRDDRTEPRILQAGFDRVRLSPTSFFRYWESRTAISIIIAHSPGAAVDVSVNTPDSGTLYPFASNETSMDKDDLTVETKPLSTGITQATVIVHRASYFYKGDYEFVISSRHSNGSEIVVTSGFFLHLDIVDFTVASPERVTPTNFSAHLTVGNHYVLRVYLQEAPVLERTRLIVEERVSHGFDCQPEVRSPKEAMDKCGLRGFSLFNEPNAHAQVGVQILLVASQPCVLTVITELHDVHNASVKSSLITTTFDPAIFREGDDARKAVIRVDPPLERGEVAFVNETLNINCIIPKCHLFLITWGKVENDSQFWFSYPPLMEERGQTASIYGYTSNGTEATFSDSQEGRVNTLHLPFLQYEDSGQYVCGLFSPSSSNQHLDRAATVKLTINDPVKPYFTDGKQFHEEDITLQKGSIVNLFCNVTGDPEPKIKWYSVEGENSSRLLHESGSTFRASEPGLYMCNPWNRFGGNNRTFNVHYASEIAYVPIAIAIPTAAVFLALVGSIFWWLRRRAINASFRELSELLKNPPQPIPIDDTAPLNDQAQFIPYNRKLEIKRDCFTVTSKMLGEGAYGYIFKGELKMDGHSDARLVAVKLPRDPYNLQHFGALVDEMKVMCQIRPHVNVLALAGACTDHIDKKQLFVLTDFCENGSLKDYLTQTRMKFEGFAVNEAGQFVGAAGAVEALLKYAYQAANGMTHLAAERIIHRDLALRNLLLTANHIVKIADFGMSRQRTSNLYRPTLSKDFPVPLFWMAPEALFRQKYTQKSDVWSFGIVLWEMFSCGRRPYPDHCPDSSFCNWLRETEENRMAPPNIACEEMYELMRHCWKSDSVARPTFSECKRIIARTLEERSPSMYQSIVLSLSEAWLSVSPETSSSADADHGDRILKDSLTSDSGKKQSDTQSTEKGKENPLYVIELSQSTDSGKMQVYSLEHDDSSLYNTDSMLSSDSGCCRRGMIPYTAYSASSTLTDLC